jgi:hypothetical protein
MLILMAAPCVVSAPLDAGQRAECDGILISAKRAQEAVACKRELDLRRTFECDPCPDCPEPKPCEQMQIATASFFSGFVLGLLLLLVR